MTRGEATVVVVITLFVVTAGWWPRAGEWLALRLFGTRDRKDS